MISVVQDSVGVEKERGYTILPKIERNLIEVSVSHHMFDHIMMKAAGKRSLAISNIERESTSRCLFYIYCTLNQSLMKNDTTLFLY